MEFDEYTVRSALVENRVPVSSHNGIVRYLVDHTEPGAFLQAVFSNDLVRAFQQADLDNRIHMRSYAAFIFNHLPMREAGVAWGSKEAVANWIKQGKCV